MKETGLTGKIRSTTIAATPDYGNSQRKIRRLGGTEREFSPINVRCRTVSGTVNANNDAFIKTNRPTTLVKYFATLPGTRTGNYVRARNCRQTGISPKFTFVSKD